MEQATEKDRLTVNSSCQTCRILGTEFTIDIIGPAHHESGLRYAYLCLKSLEPWCPDGKGSSFFDFGLRYRISMISKDSVFFVMFDEHLYPRLVTDSFAIITNDPFVKEL
jgi:hypothetical protein